MTTAEETLSAPRQVTALADRKAWLGLSLLVLPTLLVAVDLNAVFLAMPKLSVALHASGTQQLWVADSYAFMVAGMVIPMGSLSDRFGRRRTLMLAAAAFATLSAVAAFSTSATMLIACRLLLGAVGAAIMPSTLALIMTMFQDERQRQLAVTIWSTSLFGGAALGPVVGGALLNHFWWGSVFIVAVPVLAVVLIFAPFALPETRNLGAGTPDVVSVALCLATILPTAWAVKQLGATEFRPLPIAVAFAIGMACGVLFVRRQRTAGSPMLRLEVLADRRVAIVLVALLGCGAGLSALGWLTTQYLQSVAGLTPLVAAIAFAPMGLALAAGCLLSPLAAKRGTPATVIAFGLAFSCAGFLPAVLFHGGVALVLTDALVALGTGPLFALGTGLVVGAVAPERMGSAAALVEVSNYLGSTVGTTVFGTVAADVYQSRLHGVPEQARESVARAVQAAHSLTPAAGAAVLREAHTAYQSAITIVAAAGLVLFGVVAAAYRRTLTHDS